MIKLEISADSYVKLKDKVFEALGIAVPSDVAPMYKQPEMTGTGALSNLAAIEAMDKTVHQAAAPLSGLHTPQKRHRRTKEEMEAVKSMEKKAATHGLKEWEDVTTGNEVETEVSDGEPNILGEDVPAATLSKFTTEDCRNVLQKVIKEKSMAKAIAVIKPFGVKDVTALKPDQFKAFITAANEALVS